MAAPSSSYALDDDADDKKRPAIALASMPTGGVKPAQPAAPTAPIDPPSLGTQIGQSLAPGVADAKFIANGFAKIPGQIGAGIAAGAGQTGSFFKDIGRASGITSAEDGSTRPTPVTPSTLVTPPAVSTPGSITGSPYVDSPAPYAPGIPTPNGAPVTPVTPATNGAPATSAGAPLAPRFDPTPATIAADGQSATAGATSLSGRPLGYGTQANATYPVAATPGPGFSGAMSDAEIAAAQRGGTPASVQTGLVRTFSDGSGGPGAPARTMTPTDIAALANGNRISVADSGVGGNISSEALSAARPTAVAGVMANTPVLGSADGLSLSRPTAQPVAPDPVARAAAANVLAQQNAASDAASIANRDPRSMLGSAARNADIEASSGFGSAQERAAAKKATLDSLESTASAPLAAQEKLNDTGLRDAGETQREQLRANATVLGDIAKSRPQPFKEIKNDDGTLSLVDSSAVSRPVVTTDGKPVRPMQEKDDAAQKRAAEVQDLLGKTTGEILGRDLSGKPQTPETVRAAREQAALQHGLRTATGPDNKTKLVEVAPGQWSPL